MEASQTSVVDNASATATAADRRRSPRQAFDGNAWLSTEAGTRGTNHRVAVLDLSLHGIGFCSEEQLEPEAIHWMVLDTGGLRASARLRIASCRRNANGSYECGAEFF